MTGKQKYITALAGVTLIMSIAVFTAGMLSSISADADKKLSEEIIRLQNSTSEYLSEKKKIQSQIEESENGLDENSEINSSFIEYKNKNDELKSSIEDLNKRSSELDSQIEESQSKLPFSEKEGRRYTMEKDKMYFCPDDIPAGRYRAKGGGILIIYSAGQKARETENLDTAKNNTYTFNLAENESVKATEAITLTELKTN